MDILDKRTNPNSERYVQNLVIRNTKVQKYIIDNIGLSYTGREKFTKGKSYINRILPDIKIMKDGKIISLVECKGPNINVTDYVRGIGQLYQYEYFYENNIVENKTDVYSEDFKTLYLYPSVVLKNNDFNITRFKYPKSTVQLQINLDNFSIREFSSEQSKKFTSLGDGLTAISEFYFRDNRIFELFIVIKFLKSKFSSNLKTISRSDLERLLIKNFKVINNGNWRNAFISLTGMGFLNKKNNLSEKGKEISKLNYFDFCVMTFFDYMKPYVDNIFPILLKDRNISLFNLNKQIRSNNGGKEVLFVTQAETKYISSWLNIFRDDFGFINFAPKKTDREINYNPLKISKKDLLNNIKKYNKIKKYISNLRNF